MQEKNSIGATLTLNDLNRYFDELKAWLNNVRRAQRIQQEAFERELKFRAAQLKSVYSQLGRTLPLAPLWKRFLAEVFDYAILLVLKLCLAFIVFDKFNNDPPERHKFISLVDRPPKTRDTSSSWAMLEIIYRTIVSLYETFWMYNADPASPGKFLFGLRVVGTDKLVEITQEEPPLHLRSVARPSLAAAFCQVAVKNVVFGIIMFPIYSRIPDIIGED